MLRAKDIMTKDVISLKADTLVSEAGRIFLEKGISGAPVIDDSGTIVGIITENDLISQNKRLHIPTVITLFDAIIPLESSKSVEREIRRMTAAFVSEICTTDVVTISEDATLTDIATVMTERGVHLLPVIRGDAMVGIVGKRDVLRGLSQI